MLITAKTEIKGIRLELSIADAKEVLRNPRKIQTEIRVMLKHYDVELPAESITVSTKKKRARNFVCVCGKDYTSQVYLDKHQRDCADLKAQEIG